MSESQFGPAGKLENASDVKKKQVFLLALVIIGVLVATLFTTLFSDSSDSAPTAKKKKDPVSKTTIATAGSKVDPREVWIGTAGTQIATLEREKKALEERIRRLEEKSEEAKASPRPDPSSYLPPLPPPPLPAALPSAMPAAMPPGSPAMGFSEPIRGAGQVSNVDAAPSAAAGQMPGLADAPVNMIATTLVRPAPGAAVQAAETQESSFEGKKPRSTAKMTVSAPAQAPDKDKANKPDKDLTREDYVPAGSFFRAVMLSGLDAPTGGQVQANPHPVLLRLVDNAILPNQFRAQVKECFVVAAGYGDISSERAYLRTESLSCVNTKGQVIDVSINGWAIGDDGKAGVRGRVVSKQGQALANAIASGVLSGIGSAIKESSVDTYVGGLTGSVVRVPQPGKEFRAGLGEGVSKGLDKLTEYYIKLAEKMFPVVEVDAGRVVDIALSKGMSLKGLFKQDAINPAVSDEDPAALAQRRRGRLEARDVGGVN